MMATHAARCVQMYILIHMFTHRHGSNVMLGKDFSGAFESASKLVPNLVTMSCPGEHAEALEEQFIWAILTIPSKDKTQHGTLLLRHRSRTALLEPMSLIL